MDRHNDWRLTNQEKYLSNIKLKYSTYGADNEHEHCEFCMDKFSMNSEDLQKGYCTTDGYRWICEKCFEDFKDSFDWKL